MPVTFELRQDGRLMVWELRTPFLMDEVLVYLEQQRQYLSTVDFWVYSLVDIRHVTSIPEHTYKALKVSNWRLPNSHKVFFVVNSHAVKAVLQVLLQLARFERAIFAKDIDDATAQVRRLIARDRAEQSVTSTTDKAG
jgi:hypothetical protein